MDCGVCNKYDKERECCTMDCDKCEHWECRIYEEPCKGCRSDDCRYIERMK